MQNAKSKTSSGVGLIVVSILLGIITIIVLLQKPPNTLATAILQAVTLIFGTVGSYILGQSSATDAASELIRPHARSAFRRVRNLYEALGRLRVEIDAQATRLSSLKAGQVPRVEFEQVRMSLIVLGAMVIEQISTVDDALEDWRDIVPEEVEAIEKSVRERENEDNE